MRQDAKIFIANLDYNTTEQKLSSVFETYGAILKVSLPVNQETGRRRGFAFITFENANEAQAALDMNNKDLDGRKIRVDIARPKAATTGGHGPSNNQRRGSYGQNQQRAPRQQHQYDNDFDSDEE